MSMITLGGREFPVAPLTLGQMRRAGPAFVRIGFDTPEAMGAQVTLLLLAMQSADPSITPVPPKTWMKSKTNGRSNMYMDKLF